ncbi:MAG: nuclear transport factor 2 family protein [Sphingomonadales bacterium]|nr:nuclear transport factor 2 family protein [Sphingomonadales bacterium]
MDAQLERRIIEQLDRDEIWRVMQRYGRGLDRLDFALARSCYWDDAIEDHSHFVGTPDDFIRWADQNTLAFVSSQHALLNHSCELAGNDAYCETYYCFTGVAAQPPHFMSTGRYIDHFQKRGTEWRIANRVCIVEGKFDLPGSRLDDGGSPYTPEEPSPASRDRSDISYHRPPLPRRPR